MSLNSKSDWNFFKFFLKMKKWIKSRSNISSSSRAKLRKVSVRQFLLVARTTTLDGLLTVAARSRENAMTLSSFILVLQGHNTTTEEDANSDTTYATWKWLEGHIKAYLWIWQLLRSLQTHLHSGRKPKLPNGSCSNFRESRPRGLQKNESRWLISQM